MSVSAATSLYFMSQFEASVMLTGSFVIITRCVRLDESGSSSAHGE